MATTTKTDSKSSKPIEQDLAGAPCFIERQFPVARVSMESYKERKAGRSQTLTGLGKWWGRKPLVLVRATVLGLLLPATDDPKRDQEIFLKLMTMDDAAMWRRKSKKISKEFLQRYAEKSYRDNFFGSDEGVFLTAAQIAWNHLDTPSRDNLFEGVPDAENDHVIEGPIAKDTTARRREVRLVCQQAKDDLESHVFARLPYVVKLAHCKRPEEIDGPDEDAWVEINEHLGTDATNLSELVEQLGVRRFGHRPRVGDSFCGAGSIPFEAARIGCDAYASDLSPVAALLTWAALNIVGGGPEVAAEAQAAQRKVFEAVDKQVTKWGIEHNEDGWRADAYLYCVEVGCPECGWRVPLAPSWVIAEKTNVIAKLIPNEQQKAFDIEIRENVSKTEMKNAKSEGTVGDSRLSCPHCKVDTPIDQIRHSGKLDSSAVKRHESGLRLWSNDDVVPRDTDVFRERLYCVRWVETYWTTNSKGESVAKILRHYRGVDQKDLEREERVLTLLRGRFADWQDKGFIPSRTIEPGAETTRLQRERGWSRWHQLFTPRQLLIYGSLLDEVESQGRNNSVLQSAILHLSTTYVANWNSRLSQWIPNIARSGGIGSVAQTFYNQALNTFFNFGTRSNLLVEDSFCRAISSSHVSGSSSVETVDTRKVENSCHLWITDPPYADAVNYHEIGDFFLAWYDRLLQRNFPGWTRDSRHALAVTGNDPIEFRRSMVDCYSNLVAHMPDDGMQVVMFTHQDAAVWADLTTILWASGLRVTAAWCIATETDSALKQGNYVQGTVLLVCRKRTDDDPVFLDEINHKVEAEVRQQLDEMTRLDDDSEPNFGDADYQLAAYAAALRVLTEKPIEDIDPQKEINRVRPRGEVGPVESLIRNAVKIACDHLVPTGIDREIWKTYAPMERFYLKGLEVETHGERRSGVYTELARGFGANNYDDLMASSRANETRLKTATEFAKRMLSGDGAFATSLTRHVLYAIYTIGKTEDVNSGLNWLKTELPGYWDTRTKAIHLLDFFGRLDKVTEMAQWKKDSESARLLAGAMHNDHG